MADHVVLSGVGSDRPGLVEEVSEFVFARGGSIDDSRMANMRGQFAIIMLIAGEPEALARLAGDVGELAAAAQIHVQLTPVGPNATASAERVPYRLTGRALDQPGIVHQVANLLRSFDANIETMETTLEAAPVSAAPIFSMELIIAVPADASIDGLRDQLRRVCDTLNVDWDLPAL